MDNLGKAYGQLPTVSTPFQLQRIGSLYPDGSFFLEREKRDILFPSIGSPLRYQQSPYRGAYIINKVFLGKISIDGGGKHAESRATRLGAPHYYRKGRNVSIDISRNYSLTFDLRYHIIGRGVMYQ